MTAPTTSRAALCAALALVAARPATAQAPAQGVPVAQLPPVMMPAELARVLRLRALNHAVADTVGHIVGAYAHEDALRVVGKGVPALRRAPNGPWFIAADIDNGNQWQRRDQPVTAAATTDSSWRQWEAGIRRFEAEDRVQRPDPGGVVFVGSSSIRMWETLAEDFPGVRVINRGFGGSELRHVAHFADRIILAYRPRLVVVYAGDNDINSGRTPEQVLADFQALVRRVHAARPATRIAFISIKPSPARWALAGEARMANSMVQRYIQSDPRLAFIDVFEPMLGVGGRPRGELFVSDSLHMTPAGYRLWRALVEPYLAPR